MFRLGTNRGSKFRRRLGYEAAGTVESVGLTSRFRPGDGLSTIPLVLPRDVRRVCDLASFPRTALIKHPTSLSGPTRPGYDASTSRLRAGCRYRKMTRGDFVLISRSSSSVGIAAIQLAKHVGATPIRRRKPTSRRSSQNAPRMLSSLRPGPSNGSSKDHGGRGRSASLSTRSGGPRSRSWSPRWHRRESSSSTPSAPSDAASVN